MWLMNYFPLIFGMIGFIKKIKMTKTENQIVDSARVKFLTLKLQSNNICGVNSHPIKPNTFGDFSNNHIYTMTDKVSDSLVH